MKAKFLIEYGGERIFNQSTIPLYSWMNKKTVG